MLLLKLLWLSPVFVSLAQATFVSRDFERGRFYGEKEKVEPMDPETICSKHEDCKMSETFCGESMLLEDFEKGKELLDNGTAVHHCYPTPRCSGTAAVGCS